ncbi:MAG: hypothetical protein M1812_002358 [Candelaria pacifica]|nr:MAG: hypothetical protein M1812_002358 [Candelaria pacifica]
MQSTEDYEEQQKDKRDELADGAILEGGSTLLPAPLASFVSLAAQSTSASLRFGTFIGSLALDGARVSTLMSLELSRGLVDGILSLAGNDVSERSRSARGSEESEHVLQRGTALLHTSLTHASLLASAGFHLSSSILSSASNTFQHLLSILESTLGDTETSRAIASIVHLIRREFRDPETGANGERVGLVDLLVGLVAFALLQRWGRKGTEQQLRESGGLEVIWDVVILNNGKRADVITTNRDERDGQTSAADLGEQARSRKRSHDASKRSSFISLTGKSDAVEAIERRCDISMTETPLTSTSLEGRWPESEISHLLAEQLPEKANVSITTEETINKTITMDISGGGLPDISLPPGVTILEENIQSDDSKGVEDSSYTDTASTGLSQYKVVFQSTQNRVWNSTPEFHPCPNFEVAPEGDTQVTPVLTNTEDFTAPTSISNPPLLIDGPDQLDSSFSKSFRTQGLPIKTSLRHALKKKATPQANLANLWKKETKRPSTKNGIHPVSNNTRTSPPALAWTKPSGPSKGDSNPLAASNYAGQGGNHLRPSTPPNKYSARERHRSSVSPQTSMRKQHSTRPGNSEGSPNHVPLPRIPDETIDSSADADLEQTPPSPSPVKHHRRSSSRAASIYTLESNSSELSVSIYRSGSNETDELAPFNRSLFRQGIIPGLFPHSHLVRNLVRFARFASASYGSSFLKIMGISNASTSAQLNADKLHHHEHHSFSSHTRLPPSTILLSSFVDPQGGSDSSGHTGTHVPLVHYLSIDHESKAVVLTCRGTLGFEDILTDMTCDYDNLVWRGKAYMVHKGMHASARRLLEGGGGRVMEAIKGALNDFPDYGIVICGHSLGGGVAALLAILISEPDATASSGAAFVTVSPLQRPPLRLTASRSGPGSARAEPLWLPSGRPIHAYAYGPPATLSSSLRRVTRGLITTVVNGQDVFPSLSLGTLHDFQAVALAFKTDTSNAKVEVRNRVWEALTGKAGGRPVSLVEEQGGDYWVWSALKSLRAAMLSPKLVPPGRVYTIETQIVLQRDAFLPREAGSGSELPNLGRPATRVVLTKIKDVEVRFGELRFGSGMFGDHSPGRYETSLEALEKGVLDQ